MQENLKKSGIKKKDGKIISFLAPSLMIKHKDTKIEYTIKKVIMKDNKPIIVCYRYYSEGDPNKKVYVKIEEEEFNKYEPV